MLNRWQIFASGKSHEYDSPDKSDERADEDERGILHLEQQHLGRDLADYIQEGRVGTKTI